MKIPFIKVSRRDNCDRYYVWQRWGFGLFIHKLHTTETPGVFHNHPWDGISLIIGSYREQTRGSRPVWRTFLNYVRAERHHRVEVDSVVYTIFFHFRRKKNHSWTVVDNAGKVIKQEPWRGVGGDPSYNLPSRT